MKVSRIIYGSTKKQLSIFKLHLPIKDSPSACCSSADITDSINIQYQAYTYLGSVNKKRVTVKFYCYVDHNFTGHMGVLYNENKGSFGLCCGIFYAISRLKLNIRRHKHFYCIIYALPRLCQLLMHLKNLHIISLL